MNNDTNTTDLDINNDTMAALRDAAIHSSVRFVPDTATVQHDFVTAGYIVAGDRDHVQLTDTGWLAIGTMVRDYAITYAHAMAIRTNNRL